MSESNLGLRGFNTLFSPKHKQQRRWWVRPWLTNERRQNTGQFHQLLQRELPAHDHQSLINYLRMPLELFNKIVKKITMIIERKKTNWRDPLPPGLKMVITLRHLATGDSYPSHQKASEDIPDLNFLLQRLGSHACCLVKLSYFFYGATEIKRKPSL